HPEDNMLHPEDNMLHPEDNMLQPEDSIRHRVDPATYGEGRIKNRERRATAPESSMDGTIDGGNCSVAPGRLPENKETNSALWLHLW
ncbi:MAG: hypothetical protein LBF81_02225, partial [Prevotellaceae bacterium]|nr:hypothetical protein [Prevotellaceae bacterium]